MKDLIKENSQTTVYRGLSRENSLKTDLYELTMAAGYFLNKINCVATFELSCHSMPPNRSFLVACGLEQILDYILHLKFSDADIAYLKSQPVFQSVSQDFFDYLRNFKFTGDVWALPEGEIFFAKEPVIQVRAPIIEAQILETYLLSIMNIESLVATKATRVVHAAQGDGISRGVIDFGSRRAHGPEAGILAARAAHIAGCLGTSNVYAGKHLQIPVFGTMAHSWVEVFDREEDSFEKYYEVFPQDTTLLIDTYDTIEGVKKVVQLKKDIRGVRIDSGNLLTLSRRVRKILDHHSMNQVKIIASGNLNEYKIRELVKARAPIDIFGVGTDMVVSRDFPALDFTYKLVQIEDDKVRVKFKAKRSQGKKTIPGRKQVFRKSNQKGQWEEDILGLFSQQKPWGTQPLLKPFIENGQLKDLYPSLAEIKKYAGQRLSLLPKRLLDQSKKSHFKVKLSEQIRPYFY